MQAYDWPRYDTNQSDTSCTEYCCPNAGSWLAEICYEPVTHTLYRVSLSECRLVIGRDMIRTYQTQAVQSIAVRMQARGWPKYEKTSYTHAVQSIAGMQARDWPRYATDQLHTRCTENFWNAGSWLAEIWYEPVRYTLYRVQLSFEAAARSSEWTKLGTWGRALRDRVSARDVRQSLTLVASSQV